MSEVVLLGTGAADGWPNPFCRCTSCEDARATGELRRPTSVLVDDVLLLDCGPEAAHAATRAGRALDQVHTVLLTHEHPDHCDPAFLLWRSWIGLSEPLLVLGPPAAIALCADWIGPDDPVELREVHAGDSLTVGEHDVRVLAANHVDGAVLYDVTTPDRARLLYATDTGRLHEATVRTCTDARFDLVLLEETFGDLGHLGAGHHDLPTFAETVGRLRDVGAVTTSTTVLAIHLGHHNPPEAELTARLQAIGVRPAHDLEVLTVTAGSGTASNRAHRAGARRVLVTGGARSGKSGAAEALVLDAPDVTYVATSPSYDDADWSERIRLHQQRRPSHWKTVELVEPTDLSALLATADRDTVLLVDCLTLWLTTVIDARHAWEDLAARASVDEDVSQFLSAWQTCAATVVLVTNEVGSGIVPDTPSGRYFRDLLGSLNVRVADDADEVHLVVAGRTLVLPAKTSSSPAASSPDAASPNEGHL